MSYTEITIAQLEDNGAVNIQTGPFGTQLKASDYTDEGVPVINVRNIGYGDLRPEKLEFVPEGTAERLSVHVLQESDIVLGRKGAVDRHLFVSDGQHGWVQGSDCIRLRLSEDRINPRFASYAFLRPYHKEWMLRQCGNKATMASLNQDVIRRIVLPFPQLEKQRDIVDILSAYDDLIENHRRRIALLEEAARLLYREWFVRFRFPGHEHVKIIGDLPEKWERRTLVELAEVVMGQSPKSQFYNEVGDGLPFHQGVTDYGFRFVSHRIYSTAVTKLAEAGDILISVRAPVGRINITRDKIVLGRGLAAVRSRTEHRSFLLYALKNHFYAEDIIGTGAIYAATNKKELEGQILIEPRKIVLAEFEKQARDIDQNIENLTTHNEKLAQARDLLLPRLMNGQIAV